MPPSPSTATRSRLAGWLLDPEPGAGRQPGPYAAETRRRRPRRRQQQRTAGGPPSAAGATGGGSEAAPRRHGHPWWQVMCLTGVDYFSTLGYQPGIAALAAGLVSPVATLVLVALTLLGALPVYRRVAQESPHGQGSIAMLERLFPKWWGKLFVLVLIGFALTDFTITITLSAADGAAHIVENPLVPDALHGQNLVVTLVLVGLLAAVFLRGFTEAIGIAVGLVAVYLTLNVVVIGAAVTRVLEDASLVGDWRTALIVDRGSWPMVIAVALLVFPKLALGLSGFETGVTMMPLIKGDPQDVEAAPEGRIRNTRRLLTTAALTMSVLLILSSFATTLLIPQAEFQDGGKASGRALAYLAHAYLGNGFGTFYDLSTILILWFAGASAMAGLLNIVPRYLPRYGMAPDWARLVRPLVLVFTAIAVVITVVFDADVNEQGGAYATGVLVLILSASVAVTLSARRRGARGAALGFGVVSVIFGYTTVANVIERPDGVRIATLFILAIVATSLTSRAMRSTELRVTTVDFDPLALRFIREEAREGTFRIVAHEPDGHRDQLDYLEKEVIERDEHNIPDRAKLLFLEISVVDASDFEAEIHVQGEERFGYAVLCVDAPTVPNAIAAVLLAIRDETGKIPHIYFEWMEGNPIAALLRYLFVGGGDVAPTTREVLRQAEPDRERRPSVHVG